MNRWPKATADALLAQPTARGFVDLWSEGGTVPASALPSVRKSNQLAMVENLGSLAAKVVGAAGVQGFRPEQFAALESQGFGAQDIAEVAVGAIASAGLDLAELTDQMRNAFGDVLNMVSGAESAMRAVQAVGTAAPVVGFVWQWVSTFVDMFRGNAEYENAKGKEYETCIARPYYSAGVDRALAEDAASRLMGGDWSALFVPESSPVTEFGPVGFTCCVTQAGERVIAPIGVGIGNRLQEAQRIDASEWGVAGYGFGCVPMATDSPVARGWVALPGGGYLEPLGLGLPLLGAVGTHAWSLLWSRGPTAFAVDGAQLRDAWWSWLNYGLASIVKNAKGWGVDNLCGDWEAYSRQDFVDRSIVEFGGGKTLGISSIAPVREWEAFAKYQESLLRRLVIAYVDADNCHPNWRARVRTAQQDLLEYQPPYGLASVCHLQVDSIPNVDYRAAVLAKRTQKGAPCFQAGKDFALPSGSVALGGPSLDPVGESAPEIPDPPKPPRSSTEAPAESGGGWGVLLAGAAVAGLGALALSGRR